MLRRRLGGARFLRRPSQDSSQPRLTCLKASFQGGEPTGLYSAWRRDAEGSAISQPPDGPAPCAGARNPGSCSLGEQLALLGRESWEVSSSLATPTQRKTWATQGGVPFMVSCVMLAHPGVREVRLAGKF